MSQRVRILYNPASGRGRGAKTIVRIKAAFARFGFTDLRGTERAGDETRLVDEALQDGIDTIVVAGGDGTASKCARVLGAAGSPARMAIVAAGTGNDFVKNLASHPRDAEVLAARLAGGVGDKRVDLLRIDGHLFLNVVGFGFDVAVLAASNRTRWLKGPAVYVGHAVKQLFSFKGINFGLDGEAPRRRLMAAISNGKSFGGAFPIAPDALVDDGLLDAILVDDVPVMQRAPVLAAVMRGTHLANPHCAHRRAASFRLEFDASPMMDADGELLQAENRHVDVGVVPGALRMVDG